MADRTEIELSEREKNILQSLIHMYVLKASPIGSRLLSKHLETGRQLSAATIRNVMSDLEEMNFITHPHTSAGRIPTDKGYRFYVNSLMKLEGLSEQDMNILRQNLLQAHPSGVLKDASKILGMLSRHLSIVEIPNLKDLVVEKIDIVSLSSKRILVVIALDSDNVRTVTLEADFDIDIGYLSEITSYINEKISGRPLRFLRENFHEMISDFDLQDMPLVRLFVDSVEKIFRNEIKTDRILINGTANLLNYPEFENPDRVRSVIEIIENEDIIIHMLDKLENSSSETQVLIGSELDNSELDDYSLIVSSYKLGPANAAIGLIGPKRMNYSRMISIVEAVSEALTSAYHK